MPSASGHRATSLCPALLEEACRRGRQCSHRAGGGGGGRTDFGFSTGECEPRLLAGAALLYLASMGLRWLADYCWLCKVQGAAVRRDWQLNCLLAERCDTVYSCAAVQLCSGRCTLVLSYCGSADEAQRVRRTGTRTGRTAVPVPI
jgi:hypothetical protein